MTTRTTDATDAARQAAQRGMAGDLMERLADRFGGRASVQAAFGEPIQRDDLTIVPVARVRWGFGGGAGSSDDPAGGGRGRGSGSGGGGGVAVEPIGYLEIGPGGAMFRPIARSYPGPLFLLAAGLAAAIVLRGLARLIRR